jgi:hypothetical protein
MGNSSPKPSFGTIHPVEGKSCRPGYYCNKNNMIYGGQLIEKLPEETTLKKMGYGYAKTNVRVLYKGKTIINANPDTFTIINRKSKSNLNDIAFLKKMDCVIATDTINDKPRYYRNGELIKIS